MFGRAVRNIQMGRLHTDMPSESGIHQGVEHPGYEQSPLDRVLWLSGQEHLLDIQT
jgi:hypothetical protein